MFILFLGTTSSDIYDVKFQSTHVFQNRGYYATFKIYDGSLVDVLPKHSTHAPSAADAPITSALTTTIVPSNVPQTVKQDVCNPIKCDHYCYFGFEKDEFGCHTCDCVESGEGIVHI